MKVFHRMVAYILNNARGEEVDGTGVLPNMWMAMILVYLVFGKAPQGREVCSLLKILSAVDGVEILINHFFAVC